MNPEIIHIIDENIAAFNNLIASFEKIGYAKDGEINISNGIYRQSMILINVKH